MAHQCDAVLSSSLFRCCLFGSNLTSDLLFYFSPLYASFQSLRGSPRDVVKTGPLHTLLLKFLPTDSNHFFIGTNMVSLIHVISNESSQILKKKNYTPVIFSESVLMWLVCRGWSTMERVTVWKHPPNFTGFRRLKCSLSMSPQSTFLPSDHTCSWWESCLFTSHLFWKICIFERWEDRLD